MKRSYDYSFVPNTDDCQNTTSGIHIHSFEQQTAAPATHQQTLGNYSTIPQNIFLTANAQTVPTLEFRVPLLSSTVGFSSEFQSNTGLGDSFACAPNYTPASRSRLAGLGIRYDGPVPMNNTLGSTHAQNPQDSKRPQLSSTQSLGSATSAETTELTLHDICNLGSSPIDRGRSSESLSDSHLSASSDKKSSAYSECPTFDYQANLASASSSVGSLSYGSGSEADTSSNFNTSPRHLAADHLAADFLRLTTPPLFSSDDLFAPDAPPVGLYADINMHELAYKDQPEDLGVNPADIMGHIHVKTEEGSDSDSAEYVASNHSPPSETAADSLPDETLNAIVSILSGAKHSEEQESKPPAISAPGPIMNTHPLFSTQAVPTQPALTARSTTILDMAPIPMLSIAPNFNLMIHQAPAPVVSDIYNHPHPCVPQQMSTQDCALAPKTHQPVIVHPQSPVLNAHQGIELEDLRRRADEFRRRNPGVELDKTWLQAYAGRLSTRGELMEDYRCYVNGCTQKNKRRDHILVHVGSHVEHRPFHCTSW